MYNIPLVSILYEDVTFPVLHCIASVTGSRAPIKENIFSKTKQNKKQKTKKIRASFCTVVRKMLTSQALPNETKITCLHMLHFKPFPPWEMCVDPLWTLFFRTQMRISDLFLKILALPALQGSCVNKAKYLTYRGTVWEGKWRVSVKMVKYYRGGA